MRRRTLYVPALIVAAVLVACAAALLALSEKAEATFPGKNGRIAYDAYALGRGSPSQIFTINLGGGGKTKVTNPRVGGDEEPSYSPNGKRIAYSDYDEDFDHEIYTINVGGGGKTQVTDTAGFASDPSWGSRP